MIIYLRGLKLNVCKAERLLHSTCHIRVYYSDVVVIYFNYHFFSHWLLCEEQILIEQAAEDDIRQLLQCSKQTMMVVWAKELIMRNGQT